MSIADNEGFLGRECSECRGYFEIAGRAAEQPFCQCPYCGHSDSATCFSTQEQIDRALAGSSADATSLTAVLAQVSRLEFGTEIECDRSMRFKLSSTRIRLM